MYINCEVHSLEGRADALVETLTHIYILEFKINSTGEAAFQQIIDNKYAAPYGADSRVKMGIGVNFNTITRQLEGWKNDVLKP